MECFFAEKEYNCSTEFSSGSNKIDLTLKLSPCGEDPEERKLKRSSSMVGNEAQWDPFVASLDRSCSLPSEAEKGIVSFGEFQTISRVETGKRMLLQRQSKVTKHDEGGSYTIPHMARKPSAEVGYNCNIQKPSTKPQENHNSMVNSNGTMKANGIAVPFRPSSDRTNKAMEIASKKRFKLGNYCTLKGDVMKILRQMPSVTTTGDGPNGKRIEGFLYKYMNGEVCIVCVCHGNFLTPAEFIVHAGGRKVENPMKHITVFTNSF